MTNEAPQADGIYRKYNVTRTDGRDAPGEKHHGCVYFVLDIEHDKFAAAALRAYAAVCATELPELAMDVRDMADVCDSSHGRDVEGADGYFPPPCYRVIAKLETSS